MDEIDRIAGNRRADERAGVKGRVLELAHDRWRRAIIAADAARTPQKPAGKTLRPGGVKGVTAPSASKPSPSVRRAPSSSVNRRETTVRLPRRIHVRHGPAPSPIREIGFDRPSPN